MKAIDETLAERGNNYGEYRDQAALSQKIKTVFMSGESYMKLTPYQHESLDMIANKLARILNGDPSYADSWHDIAGYSTLVVDELLKGHDFTAFSDGPDECDAGAGYVNQD